MWKGETFYVGEDSVQAKTYGDMDPSESELIDALQQAQNTSGDTGFTTVELAGVLGWRRLRVREELMSLKGRGLLRVSQGWRENLAGRMTRVPVYRLVIE